MSSLEKRRSSVPDLTIEEILDEEKSRYKRKGWGFTMSVLITLSYFFIFPKILMQLYPTEIKNEGQFQYFTFLILHSGGFIGFNLMMYVIYHLELPFFERYKVNDRPWPWNNKNEDWNGMLYKTIKQLLFNHLLILPIVSAESLIRGESNFRCDRETFPDSFEIISQIVIFMISEDFCFYWAHRFLHWDYIYPYIHKRHHLWINSISIASEYAHPIEFIVSNVLTTNIAPLIFNKRTHILTMYIWVILRLGETTDGHCGYEFSWSPYRLIPLSGSSEFHNFHHLNYKGNYASFFSVWDRVLKTVNAHYATFIKKKVELCKDYDENKKRIKKEYDDKIKKLKDNYVKDDMDVKNKMD